MKAKFFLNVFCPFLYTFNTSIQVAKFFLNVFCPFLYTFNTSIQVFILDLVIIVTVVTILVIVMCYHA